MKVIELTDTEHKVLLLLAGIGLSAFETPAGPAYVLKGRLEAKEKLFITEQDIINVIKKIEEAK